MEHAHHAHHNTVSSQVAAHPHHDGSEHGSMHSMAFHFGNVETILFSFWHPHDTAGMVLACAIVVAMCFVMEFVRFLRNYRNQRVPLPLDSRFRLQPTVSSFVLIDAVLHLVQLALSYSLMLIFMSFNVWLCLAVLLGEVGARLLFAVLFPYMNADIESPAC
ncbi:hypothetical protein Q1695_010926 [Nippostrongylus brasiliensis]|nr:hypothetical protein Q1695_010926 [Nippostrongylus brasiliensis]